MTPSPEDWGVTPAEARDLLGQQICPICGEGPWRSPLNHVARKHGIDRLTMRDVCLLTGADKVTEAKFRTETSERMKKRYAVEDLAEKLRTSRTGKVRRKTARERARLDGDNPLFRWVEENSEAIAALRAGFRDRVTTTEAREAWERAMLEARGKAWSPERRAAFAALMASPEVVAKRAAARPPRIEGCGVQGCERAHVARGLCAMHYQRAMREGR